MAGRNVLADRRKAPDGPAVGAMLEACLPVPLLALGCPRSVRQSLLMWPSWPQAKHCLLVKQFPV